ncbi:MAG: SRPBCC family protein [Acidimicrobiales bacterium]
MTPDLEVSRDIAASAEAVFDAIADVTRMGEWSPECVRAEWSEGFSEPAVGAMFMGHNVNGDKKWSIESKIVELVKNERFFFDCISSVTPGYVFASWGYSIEPTDSGCTVTEYWQDQRPKFMLERSAVTSGVSDRVAHNRAGMEATLERIAAAVESS